VDANNSSWAAASIVSSSLTRPDPVPRVARRDRGHKRPRPVIPAIYLDCVLATDDHVRQFVGRRDDEIAVIRDRARVDRTEDDEAVRIDDHGFPDVLERYPDLVPSELTARLGEKG